MNNFSDNDLIEHYLLGKLDETEIREFKIRLEEDREFARKFRMISMFPEMMSKEGKEEYDKLHDPFSDKPAKKSSQKRWLLPVIVIFILAAGVVSAIFLFRGKSSDQPEQTPEKTITDTLTHVEKDTTTTKKQVVVAPDTIIAQKPEKELLPEVTQTGSFSPADGKKIPPKDTILFRWEQKADTFSRIVIISHATGKIILWRGIKPGMTSINIPAGHLSAGDYSWYVGSKYQSHSFSISEE